MSGAVPVAKATRCLIYLMSFTLIFTFSLPAEREAWEKRGTKWKVCVRTGEVNGQNFSKRHFGYQPTQSGIGVLPSTLRCKCADILDDRREAITVLSRTRFSR